jgi:serine/threonine protein kinase
MPPEIAGLSGPVEVGRGGFGVVYRAHDDRFDREVALKVIRETGLSDEVVARFARECRALGSLSGHPNIVSIYDAGQTDDGELYLVMEFLPRGSLAHRVTTAGVALPRDVLAWGAALAGALETAHRSGIIHRDVKPENVLFSTFGAPKLVDFGIARMRTAFETRSGQVSATLSHAAPEIIGGAPSSAQSDVYSLASVLFHALTGHAPFDRPGEESLAPLIARIATAAPPDLREHGVPEPLAAVIARGLAKDPADRPATAAAFGQELQDAATALGLPVPEVPVSDPVAQPATTDGLFAVGTGDRATPKIGTVQVARRRESLPSAGSTSTRTPRRGRLVPSLATALIVLGLAGAGVGWALTRDDGVVEATPLQLADSVTHTDVGLDIHREYAISDDGSTVGSTVRLVNTSEEDVKQIWFEVIPPELAALTTDVTFSPEPAGTVEGHVIVYWVLALQPGGEQRYSWTTPLPDDAEPSQEFLREVRAAVEAETAATEDVTDARRAELAEDTGASAEEPTEVEPDTRADEEPSGGPGVPGTNGTDPGDAGEDLPDGDPGTTDTGTDTAGTDTGGTDTGGDTSGDGGTQEGNPGPAPEPDPAPTPNRNPTITATNQSNSERQSVNVTFSASDPDGDSVSVSVTGLPAGLSASGGRVTGTISHNAANATVDRRQGIRSQSFSVAINASDGQGGTASRTVTWTISDTHTVMPNYIGTYGCGRSCPNGSEGNFPDVAALSTPGFFCRVDSTNGDSTIVAQSVGAGNVVAWGQAINYTYREKTC